MRFFNSRSTRRWSVAFATLILAFVSGHVTQTVWGRTIAEPTLVTASDEPGPMPVAPRAVHMQLQRPPVMADRVAVTATVSEAEDQSCRPQLSLAPAPAATLHVELIAPCHGLVRTHVTQGQITASMTTDEEGLLLLRLPALTTDPLVEVSIAGIKLAAHTDVPEANAYQHVALQWIGPQTLGINAYEFGAQQNQFGHVWAGAPKSPARATRGSGGFLTRLGDGGGTTVEIYSFPTGSAAARGVIRLVAEAKVTQDNCGRRVTATALQSSVFSKLRPTEVAVTMPTCGSIGETVSLQNLFQDMRLARR